MPPKPGFYAVRVGRKAGVYNTWNDCELQIKGYAGAIYKKFTTSQEAEEFVGSGSYQTSKPGPSDAKGKKRTFAEIDNESAWGVVYSDGACKSNGKVGSIAGIGVWCGHNDPRNLAERCPGEQTNNRAELIAILRVLETIPLSKSPLLIKTDSQYSINCFQMWIHSWIKNNWKTAKGQPVKNAGIIRCISKYLDIRAKYGQKVRLQYVKGHSGDVGNDGADFLANQGTTKPPVEERDWESLLEKLSSSIAPGVGSIDIPVEIQLSDEIVHPISFEAPAELRRVGATEMQQPGEQTNDTSSSPLQAGSSRDFSKSLDLRKAGKAELPHSSIPLTIGSMRQPEEPTKSRPKGKMEATHTSRSSYIKQPTPKSVSPLETPSKVRREVKTEYSHLPIQQAEKQSWATGKARKESKTESTHLPLDSRSVQQPIQQFEAPATRKKAELIHPPGSCASQPTHQSAQPCAIPAKAHNAGKIESVFPSNQSPVRVLYASPPLVPVRAEDIDFKDYAGCLLNDDELANELSD